MLCDSPRWLWRGSLVALAISAGCLIGVDDLAQPVYVDEAGLLAGLAAPEVAITKPAAIPRLDDEMPPGAKRIWLTRELRKLRADPLVHTSEHGEGCQCDAISARIKARRGDGREAILLSIGLECASSSAAGEARIAALVVQLAAHLSHVTWLSKDVLLHLPSCCSCASTPGPGRSHVAWAAAAHGASGCSPAPLRFFLDQYAFQPAFQEPSGWRGPLRQLLRRHGLHPVAETLVAEPTGHGPLAVETALALRRGGGLLRQALSLSLCAGEAQSLCVEPRGRGTRLPNLDLYSTIWRVAQLPSVRVPVSIEAGGSGGHSREWASLLDAIWQRVTGARALLTEAPMDRWPAVVLDAVWRDALAIRQAAVETPPERWPDLARHLLSHTAAALRPASTLLAFTAGQAVSRYADAPHAPALDAGLDALHLSAEQRGSCSAGHEAASPATQPVSDGRLLSVIQLAVRSLSNLHEALHHSHYAYMPVSADAFLPLKLALPLLLGLPLASLTLRAAAHLRAAWGAATGAGPGSKPHTLDAVAALFWAHAAGAVLLLVPVLAWPLPAPPPSPGVALLPVLVALQLLWLCTARRLGASGADGEMAGTHLLTAGACAAAALNCAVVAASNAPLAMHGAAALALLAAVALPAPSGRPHAPASPSMLTSLFDVLALALCSPSGVLLALSWTWGVPPLLSMGRAGESFAAGAGDTSLAFACAVYLPFSLCVGAVLLRRLSASWLIQRATAHCAPVDHRHATTVIKKLL